MKKSGMYLIAACILLLGMFGVRTMLSYHTPGASVASKETPITYSGKENTTALDLLEARHKVSQDASGMVVGIDGRYVVSSNHEYWAFYVNGKLASVGPKNYITKSSDQIMWKVATY